MDMAARSALFAGGLVVVALAAAAGWWFFGDTILDRSAPSEPPRISLDPAPLVDQREGSLYDEFGESGGADSRLDQRITIRAGDGLDSYRQEGRVQITSPPPPDGTVEGLPSGPRFEWNRRPSQPFDARLDHPSPPWPRTTAAERVEADCRGRGGGPYACRCLVRLARAALTSAQFEFLSLSEERDARPDRLLNAGLDLNDLPRLTLELIELDANARRRCGAGLKP